MSSELAALHGQRVMILAGGTGGHIFPGLAVAEVMRKAGARVSWLGTPHGLENRVVPRAGLELDRVRIRGLRGNGVLGWLVAPWRILRAMLESRRILVHRRPACVLSMGGYAAGPAGLVARALGIALVIHEQNAVAGWTNRLLRPWADRVCSAFPGVFKGACVTGNPVRASISALPPPEVRLANRKGPLRLLVIGGSQGARIFNEVVPEALARLSSESRPEVRHQAGRRRAQAEDHYKKAGIQAEVIDFIDDMAAAWSWADFAICRAGALTVSELAAAGVPAVLVPLPTAVDDHQTRNARILTEAGGGWLLPQSDFTPDSLARRLGTLDRDLLRQRAQRARSCAACDAANAVARACAEVLG